MAALCTFVAVTCFCCVWRLDPAERRALGWSSSSGVPGSGSSTGHLHLKSSSQVPLMFRSLSSTTLRWLPVSSFLLVCWTDSMAGYLWCTVTDVLFAHMSSCASSTSCANWSYCTMLCTMRIRYGFVSLVGRDVTLLCCAMLTVWTLHSYRCQYWGVGAPHP